MVICVKKADCFGEYLVLDPIKKTEFKKQDRKKVLF